MDFFEKAVKAYTLDEGDKLRPYKDPNGYWTIGKGHLIGTLLGDLVISKHIIDEFFKEDLQKAIVDARFCVGSLFFDSLSEARQLALTILTFTLGRNKFLKFEETIDAIKREDWYWVSEHILLTKWAKDVDPKQRKDLGRDDRVAYMFKTGKFHPDYGIDE